jgi:hypothetical protein
MLTAAQICTLSAAIAKGPGFLQQAGQFLNMVLDDLVLIRNLKMNRVTLPITLPANTFGPINLEADYLRTYDLFYPMPSSLQTLNAPGITIFLTPITMKQIDAEFKDTSTADYPNEFATDLSPQATDPPGLAQLFVYPQSSGVITLTHRYFLKRPSLVSPESNSTVPWFQFQDYLVEATAARVMMLTGDDRKESFDTECERKLQPYLIMEGDEQETVHNIVLDPRHFRSNRSLRSTKSSPM